MGKNNYLKIFTLLAFIAFGLVSCWATAESLHLLLPSWPLAFCWIVTIGFFFIASYGTKMIVDSFNQNIYVEKRGLKLIGGIVITICFWLICIMPTNTHTFFFRNVINDKVNTDIAITQNYLNQLITNRATKNRINIQQQKLNQDVNSKLSELNIELIHENNSGDGDTAEARRKEMAQILDVPSFSKISTKKGKLSKIELQTLYNAYEQKALALKNIKLIQIANYLTPPNNSHIIAARNANNNINLLKQYINNKQLDLNNAKDIQTICNQLNTGYSVINAYKQYIDFINKIDESNYTSPNPVSKVKRLTSVFDVWEDFLGGVYAGHGFTFWVIISILVDIAAFIFFDITFKNED